MRKTIETKALLWKERGWVLQKGLLIITVQAQKALGDVNNSAGIRDKETFREYQYVDTKLESMGATSGPSQNGPC